MGLYPFFLYFVKLLQIDSPFPRNGYIYSKLNFMKPGKEVGKLKDIFEGLPSFSSHKQLLRLLILL